MGSDPIRAFFIFVISQALLITLSQSFKTSLTIRDTLLREYSIFTLPFLPLYLNFQTKQTTGPIED